MTVSQQRLPRLYGALSLVQRKSQAFLTKYGSYKIELMRNAHDVQSGDERRPATHRDLISTSQDTSIEKRFFKHGSGLNEEQMKEGLEVTVGAHRSLEQVDVMKLK